MRLIFCIALLFSFHSSWAQTDSDSLTHRKFLSLVNANRQQSYIAIGNGVGNLEPMLFEASLSPSYFFSRKTKNWAVLINPQVQMRMLDQASWPIRTPSFKMYLNYYHDIKLWQNTFLNNVFYKNALWFLSVAHHSNGQSGIFYNDSTQSVNTRDGNFSTNFLEAGISSYTATTITANYFSIKEFKTYAEIHPPSLSSEGLKSRYGLYRIYGQLSLTGLMKKRKNDHINVWLQRSSFQVKSGWIFGEMDGTAHVDVRKRLIVEAMYKYYPPWFDEIAFFLRFYRGQDYYNILYADNPVSALTVGITSNIMNFKQAVKYLK